jgi:hypothetical protein
MSVVLVVVSLDKGDNGRVMGTGSSVLRKCFEDEVLHNNVDHDTTSLYHQMCVALLLA